MAIMPLGSLAKADAFAGHEGPARRLALSIPRSGERIDVAYWQGGSYVQKSLAAISFALRDIRSGKSIEMDPALLDLLHQINERFGGGVEFEVVSGCRSPSTNRMLARHSSGVAKKSLHMDGKAIDIRIPGVSLQSLRDVALSLRAGGVGFYPNSNFVHVDVGPVRSWAEKVRRA